jgi:hypothetical protein
MRRVEEERVERKGKGGSQEGREEGTQAGTYIIFVTARVQKKLSAKIWWIP